MQIRPEQEQDHDQVRALHVAAFGDQGQQVAGLLDSLRATLASYDGLSLVAEDDGAVVGHALLTRSLLDAPRRLVEVQVLSPLGVLPQRQRQGVGSALVRHGLRELAARGVPLVFLEGSPSYYARLGFRAASGLGFRAPSLRIPDAAFQVAVLPAHEPWMTGTLVYAQEFWAHDAVGLREPQDPAG